MQKNINCCVLQCYYNKENKCVYSSILYENPCWNSEPVFDNEGNIVEWVSFEDNE